MKAGWKSMKLRDVCELVNGRAYKQAELLEKGKYPVLRVGNFFTNEHWYYSDLELEDNKYCNTGDLLYAWSASFGPRIWTGGKVIFHYHIWRVVPTPSVIDKTFLYMFLLWDREQIKHDQGTGSTMIHVSKGSMEDRDISVPPLAEQRRIVAKLETLIASCQSIREDLSHIPRLIERYKQAILAAAFRGELTLGWRSKNDASLTEWGRTTLGKVSVEVRYGTSAKCFYEPKATPVLRIPNVVGGRIDTGDLKYGSFTKNERDKLALLPGDILIIRSNGSLNLVGRAALVTDQVTGFLYAGYLIRIRLDREQADPAFILRALEEPSIRQKIENLAKSTSGVNNINSQQLKALTLPKPPLAEQSEIAVRVAEMFQRIDTVSAEAARAITLLDRLDQATLARAFRGELVPQDPDDEPVSVRPERVLVQTQKRPSGPQRSARGVAGLMKTKKTTEGGTMAKKRADVSDNYLTESLRALGGAADAKRLWQRSEMDIDEFYKQLRNEIKAGRIEEGSSKEGLKLANAT